MLTSRGYSRLRHRIEEIATGLMGDLSASADMAGNDAGGHAFAGAYESAAAETFDKIAFAAFVMAESAKNLMQSAFNYLAAEDQLAAAWLKDHQPKLDYLQISSADECDQVGNGRNLPKVVKEQDWVDRNVLHPGPKGDPGKLRAVAALWRRAADLVEDVMTSAQGGTSTVEEHWEGAARQSFSSYFNLFIGWNGAPGEVSDKEALVPNLVAACRQLAKACDAYADHIEDARDSWGRFFFGDFVDSDHGLTDAVTGDTRIQSLRNIQPALEGHRIPVPEQPKQPDPPSGPGFPLIPFPVPVPVPVPLVLATYKGNGLNIVPAVAPLDPNLARKPISPPPGTPLLSPAERQAFEQWQLTLNTHGFQGGGPADKPANDYQRYVAGYPEYDLPLPPSITKTSGVVAADGLRADDGAIVEAKYVKKQGCSPRSMNGLETLAKEKPFLMKGMPEKDFNEMRDYAAAVTTSNGMVRHVDLATNDPESVVYWQYMMALNHVPGDARYIPAP
ncbi:restriction endonuclease fold toxin-2 domain-containing protein [Kitasatospora sp. NPDC058162]|uniref:restriction endonuclease fold toxin-2 domain-containing protein n=1 Tax=Kitasatospora sp. NPDC058162 TaxID=3346362 RepID=UPI0036D897D8